MDDDNLHSRDQIWRAISDVSQQQAATEARIGALETTVEAGFSRLNSTLEQQAARNNQPFPIWSLIGSLGVVAAILAGYVTLSTDPLHSRSANNNAALEAHEAASAAFHLEVAQRVATLEAQSKELRDDIDDVDKWGSRRWGVDGGRPATDP